MSISLLSLSIYRGLLLLKMGHVRHLKGIMGAFFFPQSNLHTNFILKYVSTRLITQESTPLPLSSSLWSLFAGEAVSYSCSQSILVLTLRL